MGRRRARLPGLVLGVGLAGVAVWGLQATAVTRQGVNFSVASHAIPRHVKILDFVQRDAHYRLLARQITEGLTSDHDRALAVYEWTRRNIRANPRDLPVVDDHILHIIIRGYGMDDQQADVFCTLATYAGVPAFWRFIRGDSEQLGLVLSFAKVDGAWRVFDVARGVVFRDPHGRLMDIDTLLATPTLTDAVAHHAPSGMSYAAYLERLQPFTVPATLRAEQQMPWRRILYEARQALRLGIGSRVESDGAR